MGCARTQGVLEHRLKMALTKASKWEVVVSVNEADALTPERSANECSRHEQVSVDYFSLGT